MLTDLHAITVYSTVLRVLLYERYEKDRGHRCRVSKDGRVMKNDVYDVKERKKIGKSVSRSMEWKISDIGSATFVDNPIRPILQ